jgi:hypothetical protein
VNWDRFCFIATFVALIGAITAGWTLSALVLASFFASDLYSYLKEN